MTSQASSPLSKSRCLVTGGAGFLGSHLVEELSQASAAEIRVLDDFSSGSESNLKATGARVDLHRADIRDLNAVIRACEGRDVVFHLAAFTSVHRSIENPSLCNDININGTLNILRAAKEAGVKKVVFASSSAVYGENPASPKTESLPADPLSPYAVSKLAGEAYCRVFSRLHGIETTCFRFFNIYGPRQDPSSPYAAVIPLFVRALARGEKPKIFGDGEQTRDFVFVKDVARANLLAAQAQGLSGEVFNVGTGSSVSINALLSKLGTILGCEPHPRYLAPARGDIRHSLADISRIRSRLGFFPQVALEDGLASTAAYFREITPR